MRGPQPLLRTDTRLDLALGLKQSPSPSTPRAHGPSLLPLGNTELKKTALKRTESCGKGKPSNALTPTASIRGSFLPTSSCRDAFSLPVFADHEDDDNVGLDFGKWHLDAGRGERAALTPPESERAQSSVVPGLIILQISVFIYAMVIWTSDTVGIARPDTETAYGVGSYLDESAVAAKPQPELLPTPPALTEIIPRIEMSIEGGQHLELWDAKPESCARVNGTVSLGRKTMRTIVDGRAVEIVLRGIAITASTVESPRRCENNHYDAAHPEWHVGGLSGGQQVPGRAVCFGAGSVGSAALRTPEFSVTFHIDVPMGLVQSRRDRVIVIGASAIFGSTHRPDVVRRIETEVMRVTLSNLCSDEVKIPRWR